VWLFAEKVMVCSALGISIGIKICRFKPPIKNFYTAFFVAIARSHRTSQRLPLLGAPAKEIYTTIMAIEAEPKLVANVGSDW
jgi:hypothetical protein